MEMTSGSEMDNSTPSLPVSAMDDLSAHLERAAQASAERENIVQRLLAEIAERQDALAKLVPQRQELPVTGLLQGNAKPRHRKASKAPGSTAVQKVCARCGVEAVDLRSHRWACSRAKPGAETTVVNKAARKTPKAAKRSLSGRRNRAAR